MSYLTELANKYHELRLAKDEIESRLKEINKELDSVEKSMLDEMAQEGMLRVDVQGKGSFGTYTKRFFQLEDKHAFKEFLNEQAATDLLSINHNTLNAYAQELKDRHGDSYVIPGVKESSRTKIRFSKSKN